MSQSLESRQHFVYGRHETFPVRYGWLGRGESWLKNRAALEILLNNSANKLFFRSTDQALQVFLDRLCPPAPGFGPLTHVRPPSTLRPGECYASLSDGRFERCQLLPFKTPKALPPVPR